jgi:hypothetical protein
VAKPNEKKRDREKVAELYQSLCRLLDELVQADYSSQAIESAAATIKGQAGLIPLARRALKKSDPNRQKALLLLIRQLRPEGAGKFLADLIDRAELAIEVRICALEGLKEFTTSIPSELEADLTQGAQWLSRATEAVNLAQGEARDSAELRQGFAELSPQLRTALLKRLAAHGEAAVPVLEGLISLGSDLALMKILARIPCPAALALVKKILAQGIDKELEKAGRKTLHLFKTAGLPVELEAKPPSPRIPPPRLEELRQAIATAPDSLGFRLVWLFEPLRPKGVRFFAAQLSDTVGMVDFICHDVSRKWQREQIEMIMAREGLLLAEIDFSYACQLLEEAYGQNFAAGEAKVPQTYLDWRAKLKGFAPQDGQPLIYRLLPAEEVKEESLPFSGPSQASQIKELQGWRLAPELIRDWHEKITEAKESKLIVNPEQRTAMVGGVLERAAREIFDSRTRQLYKRRLEEIAAVLSIKKRDDEAKIVLAAALAFDKDSPLLPPHPLALELVKRSIPSGPKAAEERPLVTLA